MLGPTSPKTEALQGGWMAAHYRAIGSAEQSRTLGYFTGKALTVAPFRCKEGGCLIWPYRQCKILDKEWKYCGCCSNSER